MFKTWEYLIIYVFYVTKNILSSSIYIQYTYLYDMNIGNHYIKGVDTT